jgi:hypothetical protein
MKPSSSKNCFQKAKLLNGGTQGRATIGVTDVTVLCIGQFKVLSQPERHD